MPRPVLGADPFVPVGVVDGRNQDHEVFEQGSQFAGHDPASQPQDGLLPFDLTPVDVRHHEDSRFARRPELTRLCDRRVRQDYERE